MENYEQKWQTLFMMQHGKCAVSGRSLGYTDTDLHHAGKHNAKWARIRWPRLIDSVVNIQLVNHDTHMTKPLPRQWPDWLADEIEQTLADDEDLCAQVNCRAEVLDIEAVNLIRDTAWRMAAGDKAAV